MIMTTSFCLLLQLKAACAKVINVKYIIIVEMLRGSVKDETRGTLPIVQSQHKSQGNNSSQVFNEIR